jgi:4-hydroxy-3-polyprenylbenzoate decarboxylase
MHYPDLRAFLSMLEERGKLYHWTDPVDKDTELCPLLRVQLRGVPEPERKVLVFDHVTNAAGERYEMGVAANVYGLSDEIVALGMGCETPQEMLERWHHGLSHPIPPRLVDSGAVQEEVHVGDDLLSRGLDEIPVPVEEVGFSQVIRTGLPMITQDPETGIRNVGTYNGFLRDRDRIVTAIGLGQHAMRYHWQTARRRGEDLPLAIVIGATPNVMQTGSARIPYGTDELAVAGGLTGEPVEIVRCKTIPVEVPAHAEIVIEGMLSTDVMEPRYAFGEYPGYMNVEQHYSPILRVTAITHRKNALFTPVLVGFPPSDSNALTSLTRAGMVYHTLRYAFGLPVADVSFPQMSGGNDLGVVRLEKGAGRQVWSVLHSTASLLTAGKYIIAVDEDVDIRDMDLVIWAMTYRVKPERDIQLIRGRFASLDPAFGPTGSSRGHTDTPGGPRDYFRVLIDATRKGAFPPLALPKREYMERALERWNADPSRPRPRLRMPWHGYTLGYWREDDQQLADLITAGDYKTVGRIAAEMLVKADEVAD